MYLWLSLPNWSSLVSSDNIVLRSAWVRDVLLSFYVNWLQLWLPNKLWSLINFKLTKTEYLFSFHLGTRPWRPSLIHVSYCWHVHYLFTAVPRFACNSYEVTPGVLLTVLTRNRASLTVYFSLSPFPFTINSCSITLIFYNNMPCGWHWNSQTVRAITLTECERLLDSCHPPQSNMNRLDIKGRWHIHIDW